MARLRLQQLGADSPIPGAEAMANDPEALDRLFAKMQEPETLAKLQEMAQVNAIAAAILRAILGNF